MAESHREEIAKLEALYAGNPGGRVFVHLAEAYRKAGEHERARRILDEGLARHTDSASGYVVLGRVLADMQISDEAEVAFRRVLELDSGNLVALRWLGDIARQSGRTGEAIGHYRELLARNPSNEEVRELVEIVEREAAGGAPALSSEPAEPEWQEPEPVEQVAETPAEPLSPLSAAPGRTGDEEPAEVEFGLVEIDAGTLQPQEQASASEEAPPAPDGAPAADAGGVELELPSQPAGEGAIVERGEEELDAALDQLSSLARSDEADDLEIHLLDPAYTGDEEPSEGYAEDEFIADLLASAGEEPEPDALDAELEVLGSGSALTLHGDADQAEPFAQTAEEPSDAAAEPSDTAERAWLIDSRDLELEPEPDDLPTLDDAGWAPERWQEPDQLAADVAQEADTTPAFEAPAEGEPVSAETEEELAVAAEGEAELTGAEAEREPAPDLLEAAEPPPLKPHGDDLGAAALEAEPGPVTETMAELYRAQGFPERAAEVYRALLRQRPFDLRLSAKLSEAEADAAEAEAARAGSAGTEPEDEAAGEVWLRGVGAPWDAGAAEAESTTPYTWTEQAEDQPAGEPIGSYLRDLVSWKTAGQRWAESGPPPTQQQPASAAGEWSLDDEPWASAPADGDWGTTAAADTVDPWGSGAQDATSPWGAPAGEGANAAESWDPAPSTPEAAAPQSNAEPADPWLQGTTQPPADPWGGAAQTGAPEASAASGWGQPGDAAAQPPPAPDDDTEAEDEDLEMFRSWLQSLKK